MPSRPRRPRAAIDNIDNVESFCHRQGQSTRPPLHADGETRPAMTDDPRSDGCGPWNPGIVSQLPREYLPLETLFRAENVETGIAEAHELADFCGLPAYELVRLRAGRLAVHELLIRVTADLSVPDGTRYVDLGLNFRAIAGRILDGFIAPHLAELDELLDSIRRRAAALVARELHARLSPPAAPPAPPPAPRSVLARLGLRRAAPAARAPADSAEERIARALAGWNRRADAPGDAFERACCRALATAVSAVQRRHGALPGDAALLGRIAVTLISNGHGSDAIGDAIEPYVEQAVVREGYQRLPRQARPVVMNVKGASASGKSTTRPLERALAKRLDIPWTHFALISPDIWRKFLLDYDSLGNAYKYAGTLTGHEIEIVDRKLDGYMARKAAAGRMSHLLIDRFRFDSFVPEGSGDEHGRLLTRFGHLVYMFFMITPPADTVERAWLRGLEVGRYKAVDDLLDHNVEAFTGMPNLFFTWALRTDKRVHCEFLDNSVAKGSVPRTVAFGWNGELNVLDVPRMLDVERFRKVNVDARCPAEVLPDAEMAPEKNTGFLRQCARRIPVLRFADAASGAVYAQLERGEWTWCDEARLERAMSSPDVRAGLEAIGIARRPRDARTGTAPPALRAEHAHTMGAWGARRDTAAAVPR